MTEPRPYSILRAMNGRQLTFWMSAALAPLLVFVGVYLSTPADRTPERASARAVAAQLESYVDGHTAVVRALAERLSQWESLPGAAVQDTLRTAAARLPGLRQLIVADAAGRLIAGYDANRPPGREPMTAGSLDPVLGRRKALRGAGPVVVLSRTRTGTIEGLDLAAPIRRADGSRLGYVGASVSLARPREQLREQARAGAEITVTDLKGARLFPCHSWDLAGGSEARAGHFTVRVRQPPRRDPWVALTVGVAVVPLLLLGIGLRRILDRRR